MPDQFHDANEFHFDFPLWIVSPKGHVELAETGRGQLPVGDIEGGGSYVPIFTDEDLAKRYAEHRFPNEGTVGSLENLQVYANFLNRLLHAGVTHLALDPAALSTKCKLVNLTDALRDLKEKK